MASCPAVAVRLHRHRGGTQGQPVTRACLPWLWSGFRAWPGEEAPWRSPEALETGSWRRQALRGGQERLAGDAVTKVPRRQRLGSTLCRRAARVHLTVTWTRLRGRSGSCVLTDLETGLFRMRAWAVVGSGPGDSVTWTATSGALGPGGRFPSEGQGWAGALGQPQGQREARVLQGPLGLGRPGHAHWDSGALGTHR